MSRKISRRRFLSQAGLAIAGTALAACGPQATPTTAPPPAQAPKSEPTKAPPAPTAAPTVAKAPAPAAPTTASQYKEAPALAELVKAGKLPPVDQRLPKDPKVVNEFPAATLKLETGKYGGTCRFGTSDANFDAELFCACNEPFINFPGIINFDVTPNVCKDVKVSADSREFTFVLREGMKWSDGQPVTMADVRFAIEDVILNPELTPSVPAWLRAENSANGEVFKFEVIDDHTFKISFAKPYGGFLAMLGLTGWRSYTEIMKPAHYLKQYHKKHADPTKLEAAIKENKLETWVQLFTLKDITNFEMCQKPAIGFPSLYPWVLKEIGLNQAIYERNPYYFKVDAAGQQLPYLDTLVSIFVSNAETLQLKIVAGEIDFTARFTVLTKMALYKENAAAKGYRVSMVRDHVEHSDFILNLTHPDENWRKIVRDRRFRQALNLAIDRKEILDTIYYGFGEMPTVVPSEYDVAKANALLDEMGMNKRDAEGFRLGPDGKTFLIPFEVNNQDPTFAPAGEIVVENWKKIGIKASMKIIDANLWSQRNNANELYATVFYCALPLWFQGHYRQENWGPLWVRWWNSGGKQGEEPPEEVKTFLKKVDERMLVSIGQAQTVINEARKMMYDNIWFMPPLENVKQAMITNAKFGNIPESQDVLGIAVNFSAEQFFVKS